MNLIISMKSHLLIYTLYFLLFLLAGTSMSYAQENFTLDMVRTDGTQLTEYATGFPTPEKLNTELRRVINVYKENGHYAASIDSLKKDSTRYTAYIYVGEKYENVQIDLTTVPEEVRMLKAGSIIESESVRLSALSAYLNKWLVLLENSGYPFATAQLVDTEMKDGTAYGRLEIEQNNQIRIDSLVLKGTLKMSKRFLQNYFNIHPEDIYNESLNQQINDRIRELPYASAVRAPYVEFIEDRAHIYIFMKPQNASRFDLLLGLLPRTAEEGGGVELSGEGELKLWNALKQGEKIELNYKNYPAAAQQLEAAVYYPYLPYLPLGLDTDFKLYIRDTLYIDRRFKAGLQYQLTGNDYVKFFYENEAITLLTINEQQIISSRSLPDNIDTRINNYGLSLHMERLDYRNNPRKGWLLHTELSAGRKKIPRNGTILDIVDDAEPDYNFSQLYAEVEEVALNTKLSLTAQKFWPIGSQSTLLTGLRGAYLSSPNIFLNDLYRIGGSRLLRGFDEETIFTDRYAVATAEYRYLIGENSYFNAFIDQSYRYNSTLMAESHDWPLGFGAGFNFETTAGIFGLSYALGRQFSNPLDLRSGKIHFGYVNLF